MGTFRSSKIGNFIIVVVCSLLGTADLLPRRPMVVDAASIVASLDDIDNNGERRNVKGIDEEYLQLMSKKRSVSRGRNHRRSLKGGKGGMSGMGMSGMKGMGGGRFDFDFGNGDDYFGDGYDDYEFGYDDYEFGDDDEGEEDEDMGFVPKPGGGINEQIEDAINGEIDSKQDSLNESIDSFQDFFNSLTLKQKFLLKQTLLAPTTSQPPVAPPQPAPTPFPIPGTPTPPPITNAPVTSAPVTSAPVVVAAPTPLPSPAETDAPVVSENIEVPIIDFFSSYVVSVFPDEPDENDRALLISETQEFIEITLNSIIDEVDGIDLVEVQLSIDETEFNTGNPEDRFNYYVDWDAVAIFTPDSFETEGEILFEILVEEGNFTDYILSFARSIPIFATTIEVRFAEI